MPYTLNTVEAEFAKDPKINRDDIKELIDWVPTVDNMPKVTGEVIFDCEIFMDFVFSKTPCSHPPGSPSPHKKNKTKKYMNNQNKSMK